MAPAEAKITPDDPYYGNQWYLSKIKADSAWDKISASPDIVIAVIDSGVDINHPDLKNNIWHNDREIAGNGKDDDQNGFIDDTSGWDFTTNTPDPSPKFSDGWSESGLAHGTMIAGLIAAQGNNGQGVAGVTWRAKIMPLKVLNDQGGGKVSDVIRAIDYATRNGADIINLSFVNFTYSEALQEAIKRAHDAGVIIVAAAGNEQSSGAGYDIDKTPIYPACYDGQKVGENLVIGVAATDALDQKANFSSYGSHCVDIAAPGISFFNTVPLGSDLNKPNVYYNGYWSGTSMAAALVSGTLALIMQANPALSQREIVNILFASADNIDRLIPQYLGRLGNGRLNVDRAVEMAKADLYSQVGRLLVMPDKGQKNLKLAAANGDLVKAFPAAMKSGASLAAGDVNADNQSEIIIGAGPGEEPQIRIYDQSGKLLKQWLAYPKNFRGGVNVAAGDLDNDNQAEIIAAPASSYNGQVKIFSGGGKLEKQWLATDKYFWGGLNVAAGDLDGSGQAEVLVAYGAGNEPRVKTYTADGRLLSSFLAYEKKFRGGVKLGAANLTGRANHSRASIIVSPGKGREAAVRIYDAAGNLKKEFMAYNKNWRGGVNLAAGDLNNDGLGEIALGAQTGATPHVRVFSGAGQLLGSFFAYESAFIGGVNLGIIRMNN